MTPHSPPGSSPARPAPSFATLVLVEPGVYTRVFDLDYQAEQFEVFHGHASTRWAHYLGTQVIVASLLLLTWELRVGPVPVALVFGAGLGLWYVAMHRAVGVVALVFSLYRRLGAFSLHAGVVTIAGAWLGRRRRSIMTGLLLLWMVSGVSFFATDNAAFAGTDYLRLKQVVGAAWAAAFVGHLIDGRRRAAGAGA